MPACVALPAGTTGSPAVGKASARQLRKLRKVLGGDEAEEGLLDGDLTHSERLLFVNAILVGAPLGHRLRGERLVAPLLLPPALLLARLPHQPRQKPRVAKQQRGLEEGK